MLRKLSWALCLLGNGSLLVAAPIINDFTVHCTNGDVAGNGQAAVVGCLLAGGGAFTGTVTVEKSDTKVLITLTGAGNVAGMFTGASTGQGANGAFVPFVTTPYFLLGGGIERALFNGMLTAAGDTTNGAEFFEESIFGTSFNPPIPADTRWNGPGVGVKLPIPVASGPVTVEGLFQGQGVAQLFLRYDTGGGTAFEFPTSVDGALVIPEPSSLLLSLPIFGFLLLRKWRGN